MGWTEYDAENVAEALGAWQPKYADTERGYEDQLYDYLHATFPDQDIYRKYAHAATEADIFIKKLKGGANVAIEIKCDLVARNEYHRLVGQTYAYVTEWDCEVVVVLCGENDPQLVNLCRKAMQFLTEHSKKAQMVEKKVKAAPATKSA